MKWRKTSQSYQDKITNIKNKIEEVTTDSTNFERLVSEEGRNL